MREMLFKAKEKETKKWVEGFAVKLTVNATERWYIIPPDTKVKAVYGDAYGYTVYEIDPDTLCQYTGMTDENGNKIWENDIAKCDDEIVAIEWDDDYKAFAVVGDTVRENLGEFEECDFEIMGNMFDNVELLEVKQ